MRELVNYTHLLWFQGKKGSVCLTTLYSDRPVSTANHSSLDLMMGKFLKPINSVTPKYNMKGPAPVGFQPARYPTAGPPASKS